jgi:hypothetical protein
MPFPLVRRPRPRGFRFPGGLLALPLLLAMLPAEPSLAASALLEMGKDPATAKELCERFKQFNAEGKSATSRESIAWVAAQKNLSPVDAEVLSTYVIGMSCTNVR